MPAGKQNLRTYRSKQCQKHVPLRVPDVTLRAQERFGRLAADEGRPPFDEFIGRAKRQAHGGYEEKQPLPWHEWRPSDENLPHPDRRNKALGKMTKPVVMIATEIQEILHPEPEWNTCVCVVRSQN